MESDFLSWRDVVLLFAGAVAVYALVLGLRLSGLSKQAQNSLSKKTVSVAPASAASAYAQAESVTDDSALDSGLYTRIEHLESELEALREEMEAMKRERHVSPQYGEAVRLAQDEGLEPEEIAERCGISIGEAELVRALSRKPV